MITSLLFSFEWLTVLPYPTSKKKKRREKKKRKEQKREEKDQSSLSTCDEFINAPA